jgi:tetratricopeptide (TPR) repeat protein
LGRYEDAINLSENAYKMSESHKNSLQMFNSLFVKIKVLLDIFEIDEAYELANQLEKLFGSLKNMSSAKLMIKEAELAYIMGRAYSDHHEFKKAEEFFKKSLTFREKIGDKAKISQVLLWLGQNLKHQGELIHSLKYFEQCLAVEEICLLDKCYALAYLADSHMIKGELVQALKYNKDWQNVAEIINLKALTANSLSQAGNIYRLKGDLNKALEYFERSLMLIEKTGVIIGRPAIFTALIEINISKGSSETAKDYLKRFEQYVKKVKGTPAHKSQLNQQLNYCNAMILKSSTNLRDRVKAELLLKNIMVSDSWAIYAQWKPLGVIVQLCELLLIEFRRSNDLEILDEIKPLTKQLKALAESQNSFSGLAEVHLLEAKLALIQTNMGEARRLLTLAQKIADDNGLGLLAQKISIEHDTLLEQLDVWEELKVKKTPISERIDAVSIEEVMERMLNKKAVEPSKISDEQPILLMVIAEGGVLLFSYPFSEEWKHNDELLGSFMSAFTSFSDEFFSEELDRVKFGQYIVLMKTIPNFSICYVFKGQSYLAKQKLAHFTSRIQNNQSITKTLDNFYKKSQVIEIKDFPFLEAFITEIFTSTDQISDNL